MDLSDLKPLSESEEEEMRNVYPGGVKPMKQLFRGMENLPYLSDEQVPVVDIYSGSDQSATDDMRDHSYQFTDIETSAPAPFR